MSKSLTRILSKEDIELLLNLIAKLLQNCDKPKYKSRGRPAKYPDEIIILSALLKVHLNLPYREIEKYLSMVIDKNQVPDFSSIFYRIKTFDTNTLECVLNKLSNEIMHMLKIKEFYAIMADGTGFGYDETIKLSYLRGKELREVKSHIKTEILIGKWNKYILCLGVKVKEAYSDEYKMLKEIIADIGSSIESKYFIADAYYGKVDLIEYMEKEKDIRCVINIRDGIHNSVRDEGRKRVKERLDTEYYRKLYKKRLDIERFIGNIKNRWGDRERTRVFSIAANLVVVRFILWNISLYFMVKFFVFLMLKRIMLFMLYFQFLLIFQTRSFYT